MALHLVVLVCLVRTSPYRTVATDFLRKLYLKLESAAGELTMEHCQRTTDNGPVTTDYGQLTTDYGQLTKNENPTWLNNR